MKEKIKQVFQNKYIRFFLPAVLLFLLVYGEKLFDIIAGDGDGLITFSLFIKVKSVLKPLLIFWIIFNIFSIVFKLGRKATWFNLGFVLIILYSIEYYLYKKDPFLKGPFDSNYYHGNLVKYGNFYDPPEGYDKDNFLTWGKKVTRNKYGFRDSPITFPKPQGVFRVMVLGDSFTWGAGLGDDEMYTNLLDSMLNAFFQPRKIEVVNCALAGSPTITERDILRSLKDTVQPDLIIVGFCVNDPQPKSEDYSIEKEAFTKKWGAFLSKMQNFFSMIRLNYIGEAIVNFVYKYQANSGKFPSWIEALGRVYDPASEEWKLFTGALSDIKNISDSLNCPKPIIGVFPQVGFIDLHEKLSEAEKQEMNTKIKWLYQVHKSATDIGFDAIDFIPVMQDEVDKKIISKSNICVNPLDGHPSAVLNRIYAREIFERASPLIQSKLSSTKP